MFPRFLDDKFHKHPSEIQAPGARQGSGHSDAHGSRSCVGLMRQGGVGRGGKMGSPKSSSAEDSSLGDHSVDASEPMIKSGSPRFLPSSTVEMNAWVREVSEWPQWTMWSPDSHERARISGYLHASLDTAMPPRILSMVEQMQLAASKSSRHILTMWPIATGCINYIVCTIYIHDTLLEAIMEVNGTAPCRAIFRIPRIIYPIHSMYAIYAYISPPNHPNVGIYIYGIHGVSGY